MIVVPFTKLHPDTAAAVPEATFVELQDDQHYRRLLDGLWSAGETFTLVEHDVVPTRRQLEELDACPAPWCGYGYGPGDWTPVFGCIRFRSELIAALPDIWKDPSWSWMQLDAKFSVYARGHGFHHHWHYPHVHHARVPHIGFHNGSYEIARYPLTAAEKRGALVAEMRLLGADLARRARDSIEREGQRR